MDAAGEARKQRKKELLTELSEIMIHEKVEEGMFLEPPHYSVIQLAAVQLGRELSREAHEPGAREVAANRTLARKQRARKQEPESRHPTLLLYGGNIEYRARNFE